MARRKYIRDYRLVETVDERGRIRTEQEYIGADYRFVRGAETARRDRRRVLTACAAGWLLFLGGLLPRSAASFTMYVTLPYVFAALPLGLVTAQLMEREAWREPLKHRSADRLANRYPPAALAWAVLAAAALLGEAVCLIRNGAARTWGDGIFALCAALLAAAGAYAFARRGSFETEKQ